MANYIVSAKNTKEGVEIKFSKVMDRVEAELLHMNLSTGFNQVEIIDGDTGEVTMCKYTCEDWFLPVHSVIGALYSAMVVDLCSSCRVSSCEGCFAAPKE